jgi:L-2,4-diaminobutyrate decarboxylase
MTIHDDPRYTEAPVESDTFRRWGEEVLALLQLHLDESRAGGGPVLAQRPMADIARDLDLPRWIREGGMDAAGLGAFLQRYLADSTRLHHPAYMGHQVAVPHFPSALADLVHGTINNGMAIYEMGASATVVEAAIVDWMVARIGWDTAGAGSPRAGGVLTHGGSLANLTALLAARARVAPDAWQRGVPGDLRADAGAGADAGADRADPGTGRLVVLAPASAHYSIARAVSIMGLGSDALVPIPVDGCGRADASALPGLCDAVTDSGRTIMAVVASAVSTAAGVHDPIAAFADACAPRGLWLHVDGAHGASALLSETERVRLAGIERADSVVWDAHKLLRTSTLCAAALFRDVSALQAAFRQHAPYLGRAGSAPEHDADRAIDRGIDHGLDHGLDLIGRTVECTKASLGLKLFLVLAAEGEAGLARHVETLHAKAAAFHDLIAARPRFQCLCPPESNILCFRWAGYDDAEQAGLRAELVRRGEFYITQADVGGRRWLRLVIMNPATDEAVIERLLDSIEGIVGGI